LSVDALQTITKTPGDGREADSDFYQTLTNIADLALKGAFLIPCCTATVTNPVDEALKYTHRNRVILPMATLESPEIYQNGIWKKVFDEDDRLIKILVSDCGGHGRALESLQMVLRENDIKNANVDLLMNNLYESLRNLYSEAIKISTREAQAIARAALTHTKLEFNQNVPGTDKLPYKLAIPGLVRYYQPGGGTGGYFNLPYIWIWIMSCKPNEGEDALLTRWRFCDYGEHWSKDGSKVSAWFSILATL